MKQLFTTILLIIACNTQAQLTYPHIRLVTDSVWTYKNLQLIPIRYTDTANYNAQLQKPFLILQQAVGNKNVLIKENSFQKHADIAVLTIKNLTKQNILVLNGELLKGGKQDRMIAQTQIITPSTEIDYLSVYCIEMGRWDKKPKPFTYAGYANNAVKKAADSCGNQLSVWKEIENQFAQSNTKSTTYPYLQVHTKKEMYDTAYYNFFVKKFAQTDSAYAGFIAITDSATFTCNVFATQQITTAAFSNILISYIQAVQNKNATVKINQSKLANFSKQLFGSEALQKNFLEKHGKMFLYNGKPLHIIAYGN